ASARAASSPSLSSALLGEVSSPAVPAHEKHTIVIEAGRVIVRPGHELENVSILIEDGRILAVGEGITAPADAEVVKAAVVSASFFDSWSTVGLEAAGVSEMSATADTRTTDSWNPFDHSEARAEALGAGVTLARVQAGGSARLGGLGALVRLGPGDHHPVLNEGACISATVGITRGGRSQDIFDRVGEVDQVVGMLGRAQSYDESWKKYKQEQAEWEAAIAEATKELEDDFKKAKKKRDKEVKEAEEKDKEHKEERYKEDKQPRQPKFDPDMESMAQAVNGEIPLVVEVHRAEEIRALLEKTESFAGLRLVIAGGTEATAVAAGLAERNVPVLCWPGPSGVAGPDEWDGHDLSMAGQLEAAGVRVLIGTGGSSHPRELRLLAALAVGHGLSRKAALESITSAPAAVFDLGGNLGSVERGQAAELVLLDGDPLDTTGRVIGVVTGGRLILQ
ncbi:MAG: imidazolonepropionase-like amidohydrolase, partial [Planctomycetota bacterium]